MTLKYSERLYLCMNNYHYRLNLKFNQLFYSLNVIECTLGCQDISFTLYMLRTYPLWKSKLIENGRRKLCYGRGRGGIREGRAK